MQSSKLDATEGALKTFFLSHDIPLQEIENVPLKNKLEMIDEKMSNLQLSLVAKEALIRKLEQMRNETIITHDEKTEQLKILEEKYQKLKMFWTSQIQDRYSTTSSFLEKERNLVGGKYKQHKHIILQNMQYLLETKLRENSIKEVQSNIFVY